MHSTRSATTPAQRPRNPIPDTPVAGPQAGRNMARAPADLSESKRNAVFTKIHSEASSSDYADALHASGTREKNLQSQASLIRIGKLEVRISTLRKELKAAESNEKEKQAEKISKELQALVSEKNRLIAASGLQGRKPNRQSSRSTCSEQETSADSPTRQVRQTPRPQGGKSAPPIAPGSGATAAAVGPASGAVLQDDRMVQLNDMLKERQAEKKSVGNRLAALQQTHSESNELSGAQEKLRKLQAQIDTLEEIIATFSSTLAAEKDVATLSRKPASSTGSGAPAATAPPIREIIRRTTTRRREGNHAPGPLKRSDNPARNSTLYPQGVGHLLNTMGRQLATDIVEKTDPLSDALDDLLRKRIALHKQIDSAKALDKQSKLKRQLQALDEQILSCTSTLNRIVKKAEAIENAVLPKSERLPAADREKRYAALLARFKSEKTRKLEAQHKQLLEAYLQENAAGTTALAMLGGAMANLCTFSVGSATTRALGAYGMGVAGTFGGAAIAGALHAVLTLPILKQVMRETWTSPILAEYNNHWKLVGASWGDWWRGEQDKAKYASKDPGKTELLTIGQRLAEEEAFGDLFKTRFKVEELPYLSFMGNYIAKGFASGTQAVTSLGKTAYVWAEGSMHLPMGWISGAETSVLIQEMRSQLPTAKLVPIPSRELSAAEAAHLDSLLSDLTAGLAALRSNDTRSADDPTDREMLKAMARTRKALAAADLRSQVLGTLRQEIQAQFASMDAFLDLLAEVVARIVVLLPSSAVGYAMAAWRLSRDPLTAMLGHMVPAVLLILPPGWTARGLVSGPVRAALQAIFNGRAPDIAAGRQPPATTTIRVPTAVKAMSPDGTDADESSVVISVDSETSEESDEESSVVVTLTEGDVTDSDDEWEGQEKKDFVNY